MAECELCGVHCKDADRLDEHVDHRLAAEPGGHPVIPIPVRWRLGAHGDPIAVFDHIVLHLWPDGTVTWTDELTQSEEVPR